LKTATDNTTHTREGLGFKGQKGTPRILGMRSAMCKSPFKTGLTCNSAMKRKKRLA